MKKTILPAPGNLLLEVVDIDNTLTSGLVTPETDSLYGKVRAIGLPKILEGGMVSEPPRFQLPDMSHKLEIGDIVMFREHSSYKIDEYADPELIIVGFEHIIGLWQ